MDHSRDNVFARTALSLNKYRNIRAGYLGEPFSQRPHGVGISEHHCFGWHLA